MWFLLCVNMRFLMDLSTLEQSLSVVFIPPWFQMQFAKYNVSLCSSSLAFWLEGMWGRIILFSFFLWVALHKDIMINIRGPSFVTNWYIMRKRDCFYNMCRGMQRRIVSSGVGFSVGVRLCVCPFCRSIHIRPWFSANQLKTIKNIK